MIVYLTMDGLHSSPFISQVLSAVSFLKGAGAEMRLVVWTRMNCGRMALCEERAALTRESLNGSAALIERGLNLGSLTRHKLVRDLRGALERWNVSRDDRIVFHARSPWVGMVAIALKRWLPNSRVITDFRGAMEAEARMILKSANPLTRTIGRLWIQETRKAERFCARRSDHLFCVSRAFKRQLIERFDRDESDITVVPCFVNTNRFAFAPEIREKARAELEIDADRRVLLYCGTLRHYNKTDLMMKVFDAVRERDKSAVLLVISQDQEMAQRIAVEHEIPPDNLRIVSGRTDDVARWLQAGDLALLLREQDEVNFVACPMKFAEYIRSGVKTLVTPGIGDVSEFVREQQVGWVYNPADALPSEMMDPYGADERMRISRIAGECFGKETHIPRIMNSYEKLMTETYRTVSYTQEAL